MDAWEARYAIVQDCEDRMWPADCYKFGTQKMNLPKMGVDDQQTGHVRKTTKQLTQQSGSAN